ncbi:7 transmembrane receptor, partial [Opisthorchis viverrini]
EPFNLPQKLPNLLTSRQLLSLIELCHVVSLQHRDSGSNFTSLCLNMNTNDTLVRRWVMISHFELWEIVLFTVLFSLLVIVAVIGNAIVCILLRFRYMRCARYLKSLCNREARKLIGTGIYREYVTDNLWADECASSQHECSCGKMGIASTPGRVVIFKNTESRPGSLEGSTGALTGNITIVQPSLNSNAQDKSKNRYNELVRALSTKHRNRSGRGVSITSLFLFNLSLADFLMAILCIPPYIVTEIAAFYWPFGEPLCKIINYSQGVSIFVSSLTHVVISLDRFVLVYFPLRPRIRYRTAVGLLFGVWLLASLIPLPIMIVNRVRLSKTGSRCVEDWSLLFSNLTTKGKVPNMEYFLSIFDGQLTIELRSTYTVILMILQYFVPLGVICGTYAAIAVRVSGMQTPGERDLNRDQNLIRARKKSFRDSSLHIAWRDSLLMQINFVLKFEGSSFMRVTLKLRAFYQRFTLSQTKSEVGPLNQPQSNFNSVVVTGSPPLVGGFDIQFDKKPKKEDVKLI